MNRDDYVHDVGRRLAADGYSVGWVPLRGGPALVGYRSTFRLRWMATKLHLFVVVVAVEHATREGVDAVCTDALDYAVHARGAMRGFQSGVGVIPALVATTSTSEARAALRSRKRWAAFALQAIVDMTSGVAYSWNRRMVIGGLYGGWMRSRLRAAFPSPGAGPPG